MLRSLAQTARRTQSARLGRRSFFWGASSASSSSAGAAASAAAAANAAHSTADLAASHVPSVASDLLPLVFGVVLAHAAIDDQDENRSSSPPWTVRAAGDTPGAKGQGAFAARNLSRGERLIAERPLCIWPNNLSESEARTLFEAMSPAEQRAFMDLARTDDADTAGVNRVAGLDEIRARRATNGFSIPLLDAEGKSQGAAGMVFPQIARINHSCTPNCAQAMNYSTLRMEVYAVTDISTASELSIEYLPNMITSTATERQALLRTHFGFSSCLCPTCAAPPEVRAQSDARRTEIRQIAEGFRRPGAGADRKTKLAGLQRIQTLLEEEGYKGLPDFGDSDLNRAFTIFRTMMNRRDPSTDS